MQSRMVARDLRSGVAAHSAEVEEVTGPVPLMDGKGDVATNEAIASHMLHKDGGKDEMLIRMLRDCLPFLGIDPQATQQYSSIWHVYVHAFAYMTHLYNSTATGQR